MIFGWSVIILLSLLPVFLLFYLGPNTNLSSYPELTHKLGEIFALVGITMFALTFILTMRLKFIEDIFGGLDKVYIVHCILGGTALILIVFHPILLVLRYIPSNLYQAALYLLPSSFWSVNFGIIAMIGFVALIYATLYSKIKYNLWKVSHKFLGLVFVFAVLHMFLVRGVASRDAIFNGYYIYAAIVSIIGLLSFSYTVFLKNLFSKKSITYKIESIKKVKETHEFVFLPQGNALKYKSGQFIFVRFYNEKLSREAHPFSIASKSNDPKIKVIVKKLGDFTNTLDHVSVGDKVVIEGPYGRFNKNKTDDFSFDQVWIAGGIGITPFIGMAEDLVEKGAKNHVDLYYSVKTREDLVGLDKLREIEKDNKNFRTFPWISKENGYLTVKEILKRSSPLLKKKFYLCGPAGFKKSIKEDLILSGVSNSNIYEEDFTFR